AQTHVSAPRIPLRGSGAGLMGPDRGGGSGQVGEVRPGSGGNLGELPYRGKTLLISFFGPSLLAPRGDFGQLVPGVESPLPTDQLQAARAVPAGQQRQSDASGRAHRFVASRAGRTPEKVNAAHQAAGDRWGFSAGRSSTGGRSVSVKSTPRFCATR